MRWIRIALLVGLMALMTGGSFTCHGSSNNGRTRVDVQDDN